MGTTGKALRRLGTEALVRTGVVLTGFAVTACVAGAAWGAQDVALSMSAPRGGDAVAIEGSITGVVPGAPSAPLRLTLRNAGDVAKAITKVRADVTSVVHGSGACRPEHLSVGTWTGEVTVPARGVAHVTLPVSISRRLPAGCATAAWGLVYTAY